MTDRPDGDGGGALPADARPGSGPAASDWRPGALLEPEDEVDGYRMSLLEHLIELRSRLIKALLGLLAGLCVSLPFGAEIFDWLIAPAKDQFPEGSGFIYTEVAEKFMVDMKLGLFGACFVASPWLAWQVWAFVAPGLYRRERRMVLPFIAASSVLFVAGAAACYYGLLPWAMKFFVSFATEEIAASIKVSSYLRFVTLFLVAFGLVFETPLVILFLARMGIVTAAGLRRFRRWAILLGFTVAAVITPPDPWSQIAVAVPFVGLYELGILAAAAWGRKPMADQ